MMQLPAPTRLEPIATWQVAPIELRLAPLVRQRPRRDGVLEFVATLTVLCILVAAAVAYVRGTPIRHQAAPAPAAAAAATAR